MFCLKSCRECSRSGGAVGVSESSSTYATCDDASLLGRAGSGVSFGTRPVACICTRVFVQERASICKLIHTVANRLRFLSSTHLIDGCSPSEAIDRQHPAGREKSDTELLQSDKNWITNILLLCPLKLATDEIRSKAHQQATNLTCTLRICTRSFCATAVKEKCCSTCCRAAAPFAAASPDTSKETQRR